MLNDEILEAAKAGQLDKLKALIASDRAAIETPGTGETPLMAALYRGHLDCVEALIDAGAPLDIFSAAALGRHEALEAALAAKPSAVHEFAYDGWTPLHLAAFFGRHDAAERLLSAGADLGAVSKNALRNTPLHAGVAGGHVDVSLLLIERGADVVIADAGGHTPFHIAAEGGYLPVAKALLERGADPHAVDAEDRTPLSRAAARGHTDIVDLINLKA